MPQLGNLPVVFIFVLVGLVFSVLMIEVYGSPWFGGESELSGGLSGSGVEHPWNI
uniref:Putative ATP synthase subunit 8 n=1 Tax=Syndesmis echinorum TaxID=2019369 RepID=A0A7G5XUM0_9PLAT|nr:putative ATP synthase F0 subunit 8 [Syndesmis echinorum]QNA49655.1 putative ATP synthase subunit 8 [Syndesmis echinorum]